MTDPNASVRSSTLRILATADRAPRAEVIRADAFEEVSAARRAVAAAEAEAARIRAQAEADAAGLREAARAEGHAEGRRALAAAEIALRAEAHRIRTAASERLLRLAVTLAEQVLGQELRTAPQALGALVRQALAQVTWCHQVRVRLCPDDARRLHQAYPALAEVATGAAELTLVEDPSLGPGDCLVETDGGRVDASVRVVLASLEAALVAGAAPPDEAEAPPDPAPGPPAGAGDPP